ncbi:hypothetical protein Tco_0881151 [Tanacetum coccineum]
MNNNRSSRRQKRVPSWFVDHVMENQSQNKAGYGEHEVTEEIRAENGESLGGSVEEIGEAVMEESIGVFGKRDKEYIVENNPKVTNGVSFDSDPNFSSPNTEPNAYCNNNPNEEYDSSQNTTNDNNEFGNAKKKETYVSMARKDEIPRKLKYKSPITNDYDGEVVVFDELLVKKGSERWNLNASGYFVGYRMTPNDLRYHLGRMWGKFRIRDIIVNNDGTCLFKFRDLEGLNSVIDQGP